MKECHVCLAQCEDDMELCPLCGAELMENSEKEEEKTIEIKTPVLAVSVEDIVTCEIFKDALKDNGIPYFCDESESGMKLIFGGGLVAEDIYVDESDLERAKNIYEEVINAEPQFDDSFDGGED